jgi:hypothetical protein
MRRRHCNAHWRTIHLKSLRVARTRKTRLRRRAFGSKAVQDGRIHRAAEQRRHKGIFAEPYAHTEPYLLTGSHRLRHGTNILHIDRALRIYSTLADRSEVNVAVVWAAPSGPFQAVHRLRRGRRLNA